MGLKSVVKRVPIAVWVFENQMRLKYYVSGLIRRRLFFMGRPNRNSKGRPISKIVALTVSTNYSDLLEICISLNKDKFDHWIIVTDKRDALTLKALEAHPDIIAIFWDPNNNGALFDKGSAIRAAQKLAYSKFPGYWYLIIDSDIVLPAEFDSIRANLAELSTDAIYGASRLDYVSEMDFRNRTNGVAYAHSARRDEILGYFQLFNRPMLYRPSKDASYCDIEFQYLFRQRENIDAIVCSHLGIYSNWKGRRYNRSDFRGIG
jgi:hypothetical protein